MSLVKTRCSAIQRIAAIALACVLVLGITVAAAGAAGSKPSGTVRISWYEESLTLDPTMTTMTPTLCVVRPLMFDPLVKRDAEGNFIPALATSWKAIDDKTWEFKLRKGVKFHNGEPFNAASVRFTFDQLLSPERISIQAFLWQEIESVEVKDDYTVWIRTKRPYGPLLANLTIGAMLPPKAYNKDTFGNNPIGTGPFKFVEWVRGSRLVVEANSDYWGGAPKSEKFILYTIGEDATRMAAFRRGELDICFPIPYDEAKFIEEDPNYRFYKVLSVDTHVLSIGGRALPDDHPLRNEKVRQAMSYGIDREALVKYVLKGYGEVPRSVISPMVFGFNPNLKLHPYDPEKAKQILAEGGYPKGFSAELMYPAWALPKIADLTLAVAGQLEKIGINVKVRPLPGGAVAFPYLNSGKFELFYNSWTTYTLDADMPFWRNWHSSVSREAETHLDTLLETGRYSIDPKVRLEAYYKAQEHMYDFPGRLPLYHTMDLWATAKNVKNFVPTATRILDLKDVYLEK